MNILTLLRPLMSSLLEAIPEHVSIREDVYEEVEVDCIAGMEWDLHLLVADQTIRHVEQLLSTDAHPSVKQNRLVEKFHDKNILLQNMLSVRVNEMVK